MRISEEVSVNGFFSEIEQKVVYSAEYQIIHRKDNLKVPVLNFF
jgi:hypothetical protein